MTGSTGQASAGKVRLGSTWLTITSRRVATFSRRLRRGRLTPLALLVLALVVTAAMWPDLFAPYDPTQQDLQNILKPPGAEYSLGSDELGRDILSRIIFGARASLTVAASAVLIGFGIGGPIGLIAGWFANTLIESAILRVIDALLAFPVTVLALVFTAVQGPGLSNATIGIGIATIPTFARVARGQTLALRRSEYILAAQAQGVGHWRLMFRHIFPNIIGPLIVQASLNLAIAVLVEGSLSYLGLGIQPPTPSWGAMLRIGVGYLGSAPWVAVMPGVAIFILTLAFNILGDGLQAALDPRFLDAAR